MKHFFIIVIAMVTLLYSFFFSFRQPWCYCLWFIGKSIQCNVQTWLHFFSKTTTTTTNTHTTKPHPPHTYTHTKLQMQLTEKKVIMKLEQCPSTDDEIMCTYVQVPSKKNSCKKYLCVYMYNKMYKKEIYKSNLHFLKWMGSLFLLLAILYSVSLMFLIKFSKLTKFGFLFWNLDTKNPFIFLVTLV